MKFFQTSRGGTKFFQISKGGHENFQDLLGGPRNFLKNFPEIIYDRSLRSFEICNACLVCALDLPVIINNVIPNILSEASVMTTIPCLVGIRQSSRQKCPLISTPCFASCFQGSGFGQRFRRKGRITQQILILSKESNTTGAPMVRFQQLGVCRRCKPLHGVQGAKLREILRFLSPIVVIKLYLDKFFTNNYK